MASSCFIVYIKLHTVGKMSVKTWILTAFTVFMGGFTLAWAIASIEENELQAAGLGMLVFGGITVILFIITNRLVSKKSKSNLEI